MVEFPVPNETLPVYGGSFETQGTLLLKFPLPEGELTLSGRLRFKLAAKPYANHAPTRSGSSARDAISKSGNPGRRSGRWR